MRNVLATQSIGQFSLHFPTSASPCTITFQLESTNDVKHCTGMSRLELDIGPHKIETSLIFNRTQLQEGISSHSVTLVPTLPLLIFCSHSEANMKKLYACNASTSALNCDASFPAKFLLFPRRSRVCFHFTHFYIYIIVHDNEYLRSEWLCVE